MNASFWRELENRIPEASIALGLDRVQSALDAEGRPELNYPVVLIGGTNGKGSTSSFIASALHLCGKRVGLFTSPHIVSPAERIVVDGVAIDDAALVDLLGGLAKRHPQLTYFELFTVAAACWFAQQRCDYGIFEIGLGGRLDACNALQSVVATVLTSVGLDHCHLLGGTLREVAAEKAAIIRSHAVVVSAEADHVVTEVIDDAVNAAGTERLPVGLTGLPGADQLPGYLMENMALAMALVHYLEPTPQSINWRTVLDQRPPGRWQIVSKNPVKLIDGAHNPPGAEALVAAWQRIYGGKCAAIWLRVSLTKDAQAILACLDAIATSYKLIESESGERRWWATAELKSMTNQPVDCVRAEIAAEHFIASESPAIWTGSLRGIESLYCLDEAAGLTLVA